MSTEWTAMKTGSDIDVLLRTNYNNSCDINIAPSSDQSAFVS